MESTDNEESSVYIATSVTNDESNVCMATAVADDLDNSLSPMDGAIAISQVEQDLPALHRKLRPSRLARFRRNSLKLFRARMEWCPVGIDYVDHGGYLHVVNVWSYSWDSPPKVDCVFERITDYDKYIRTCGHEESNPD
jgi:hypothetical protein